MRPKTILWSQTLEEESSFKWASGGASGKEPTDKAGDIRDAGSIPRSGRSPGGGHGNPLQHSCLENPWTEKPTEATVHRIAKSGT